MARKTLTAEVAESIDAASQLAADAELARLRSEVASLKGRYKAALQQIDRERERADSLVQLRGIAPAAVRNSRNAKGTKHAATMVVLLSDIHCEEVVRPETVNGLNEFNLDVCEARLAELWQRFFAMLEHERQRQHPHRITARRAVTSGADSPTRNSAPVPDPPMTAP